MLSCEGLRQAERLADRLCNLWVDAIYSVAGATLFPDREGRSPTFCSVPSASSMSLADIDFNPDQARGGPSVYAERFSRDPRWESLPGFAPGKEFRRRAVAAIEGIIAAHPTRRCL